MAIYPSESNSQKSPFYPWLLTQKIDAIVFDCDGTLSQIEGIDWLAEQNNVGPAVKALTAQAMTFGQLNAGLFAERLQLAKPTAKQLATLGEIYFEQVTPDAKQLIQILQYHNKPVYVVSAGLLPAVAAFAHTLAIPHAQVFAVPLTFDANGRYQDFDRTSLLVEQDGKQKIVTSLQQHHPRLLYVGDGANDLSVQSFVARFIGYGGAFPREIIAASSAFYITESSLCAVLPLALTAQEVLQLKTSERELYQQGLDSIFQGKTRVKI